MNDEIKPIQIAVDLNNPGQFFACCGLLELADRLWPGAEGWFEPKYFSIKVKRCSQGGLQNRTGDILDREYSAGSALKLLSELLAEVKKLKFEVGDDEDSEDNGKDDNEDSGAIQPIEMRWKNDLFAIQLDWWSEKAVKPWAGSMKERVILRAMLSAIDPAQDNPFSDLRRVQYQSPKLGKNGKLKAPQKKEPFYFDPRRGNKSHPLDCGFSPDTHKMEAECCPTLEALCFIGLQRARPAPTGIANQSRYFVWTKASDDDPGLPANLIGPVTSGLIPWPLLGAATFDNYFRTDQRKHKTFSQATLERNKHG